MDFDSRNIAAGDEVVAVVVRGRQTGMERGLCLLNLLSRLKIAQASEKQRDVCTLVNHLLAKYDILIFTVNVDSITHRIWKETKLQPSRVRSSNLISCCLVCLHFLCDILPTFTVIEMLVLSTTF